MAPFSTQCTLLTLAAASVGSFLLGLKVKVLTSLRILQMSTLWIVFSFLGAVRGAKLQAVSKSCGNVARAQKPTKIASK